MSKVARVGLIFGGQSAEHDVSIMSFRNVFGAIDQREFPTTAIKIARSGEWHLFNWEDEQPEDQAGGPRVALLPGGRGLFLLENGQPGPMVDILFPLLHGPNGEDGTVQGAAALARIPCIGSSVMASAVCMDKDVAKRLLSAGGLLVAKSVTIRASEDLPSYEQLLDLLGAPMFVKPARLGSSVGVSRVTRGSDLEAALREAFRHDSKVLIEECIAGREIECGIVQNLDGVAQVSQPGEIIPSNRYDFYSYEAKYSDLDGAEVRVPADLPLGVAEEVKALALRAFHLVGAAGLARIDFFLTPDGCLVINEINTMPGFTNSSMYPKVWEEAGLKINQLVRQVLLVGKRASEVG